MFPSHDQRACSDPYPCAFGALRGHRLTIFLDDGVIAERRLLNRPVGTFRLKGDMFQVSCADGVLCFYEDDLEGALPQAGRFMLERVDSQWLRQVHR